MDDGTVVTYATTHLDSFQTPQFDAIRRSETDVMCTEMVQYERFVMGMDANTESLVDIGRDCIDLWLDESKTNPDACATWFSERFIKNIPAQRRRYDRMIVKGLVVLHKRLLNWPWSDHAPMACTIETHRRIRDSTMFESHPST